jgi:hypothetical protein
MNRRFDRDVLVSMLGLRCRVLKALTPISDRQVASRAGELRALVSDLRGVAKKTAGLPESTAIRLIAEALAICFYLSKWVASMRRANPGSERYLQAARARASELQNSLAKLSAFAQTRHGLFEWSGQALTVSEVTSIQELFVRLAKIPVPVIYSISHDPYGRARRRHKREATDGKSDRPAEPPPIPLVKLFFSIDGLPFSTPQAIKSRVQYGLRVRAEVNYCPLEQRVLELDYVTTMASEDYGITPFVLKMPGDNPRVSAEGSGHLIVRASQSLLSPPAEFRVRARFLNPDRSASTPAIVIGFYELRLRALDQDSYPVLSRYKTVDIQIPKILNELQAALPDLAPSDFDDFQQCLVLLGRYCGMVQQSGVFKGKKKVDEKKEFQQDLLHYLRMHLGEDVREAETVAGGSLDLRFKNIVIELKVAYAVKDRSALRKKYTAQPAQYTGSSIPLGITCILDMTEKEHPPANIANDITLETPPLHGYEQTPAPYPTKIAVVIIDGNLKLPSDYS